MFRFTHEVYLVSIRQVFWSSDVMQLTNQLHINLHDDYWLISFSINQVNFLRCKLICEYIHVLPCVICHHSIKLITLRWAQKRTHCRHTWLTFGTHLPLLFSCPIRWHSKCCSALDAHVTSILAALVHWNLTVFQVSAMPGHGHWHPHIHNHRV